ncbi:hypothetical protein EMIHUDRAFT_108790 [Emiliania huxleyi CCMP1516]|uniref:DUF4201 domain-containing protein n=2 Tax=Emiliania huxleyi TaxID=2903 RepID=A0A0D3KVJ4_EMIH1|nr:hypothetical protein EMIHUDRAFT_108790 [Emiliania huxleyi CCMP1516]EOD39779.1 hypothetical protein EMIHUDRAFT_108790 [Emiliania huxleyi CCMP1516]|eukprot:XP_005792208.1 hypothetical protein EMIHUDRAFT_108790 [Emiliania huxleyi CCMP1516]
MFGDDEILELYQQHKDLQEQFKEAHKASEQSRSQLISPAEIKKAIVQMEEDKEQLERKVEALHTKLHGSDGFEPMLREVGALRVEQDEQLKLAERMKEQRSHAYQAEQRLEQLSRALAGKKAEAGVSDLGRLLQKLEAELESDTREMLQHRQGLQRAIRELEERKRATASDPDDRLAMFRQQASLVAKKREQVRQRLEAVRRDKANVDAELASKARGALDTPFAKSLQPGRVRLLGCLNSRPPRPKAAEVSQLPDQPVLRGEEFRKYAAELRGKTAQYKRMKAELGGLRAEWGTLSRTVSLLAGQDSSVTSQLSAVEAKRGVAGFAQTEEQLRQAEQLKAEVDSAKGKTLEEISQVVEEINRQIKDNKTRLAPQIKSLRTLRAQHGEIEARERPEGSCLKAAAMERVKLQRIADEKEGRALRRAMPDGAVVTTYRELYERRIKEQEAQQRELRERQKALKENHVPNKEQMQLFRDLNKLLRCKVDLQKAARAEAADMAAAEQQESNVLSLGND